MCGKCFEDMFHIKVNIECQDCGKMHYLREHTKNYQSCDDCFNKMCKAMRRIQDSDSDSDSDLVQEVKVDSHWFS